jgi:dihydrofolate reductase
LRRIEGYVIVSADGMIADANGEMPASIRNDADQRFFQAGLDRAAVVVHGRHSHEGGPRAARRKRLVVTRQVAAIAPDPAHPNSRLWNPTGATLEEAIEQLGAGDGVIAIIGGTEVFSMFLPRYDAFHLTRAANAKIPGRPAGVQRSRAGCDAGGRADAARPQTRPAARSRRSGGRKRGDVGALNHPAPR